MKQYLAVILAAALFCWLAGCDRSSGKKDSQSSDAESGPRISDQTEFAQRGFAAVQYAPIYDLSKGNSIEWIGAPDFGEALEFDTTKINGNILPGKLISYKLQSTALDDRTVYLIPVMWNGRQGWIDASLYAPENSRIGVVVKQFDMQYRQEEIVFRRGDLVVFDPDSKMHVLYAPFFGVQINEAVNKNQISFNSDDVEAAKLLAKAKAARSAEREQELIQKAVEKYPNSALFSLIDDMLNPEERKTESLVALFSTAAEQTVLYAAPDFSSAIKARLALYTDVYTIERTIKQETTKDGNARWYHISEPEGWIFGLNLEGAD
jgi:hypothetical protein